MPKTALTLWFDSEAEAAAAHYAKAIAGAHIHKVERYGKAGPGPEGSVMLVTMTFANMELLLLNGGPLFQPNESVSITIYAEDQAEVDFLWTHMSEGGSTSMCGWLKDKWGFSWQITPRRFAEIMSGENTAQKQRAFAAMMGMTKFDIASIEAAVAEPF